jgi:hypothetical protein
MSRMMEIIRVVLVESLNLNEMIEVDVAELEEMTESHLEMKDKLVMVIGTVQNVK